MRSLGCAVLTSLLGAVLACSDDTRHFRRDSDRAGWPDQGYYGSVSTPQRAWRHQESNDDVTESKTQPDDVMSARDETELERAWGEEFPEEQEEEGWGQEQRRGRPVSRQAESRGADRYYATEQEDWEEKEAKSAASSTSYVVADKSTKKHGHGGAAYGGKRNYGTQYSITMGPKEISIICSVKAPLEHIIWLRSQCPDEYDRGEVIARGTVSNLPEVYSVGVEGGDGELQSSLTILKPRELLGSGVFRCEAWPHFDHRTRHRSLDEDSQSLLNLTYTQAEESESHRSKRSAPNPWNAIILGGAEMIDDCFYGSYGDKYRRFRSMDANVEAVRRTNLPLQASEKSYSEKLYSTNSQIYQDIKPLPTVATITQQEKKNNYQNQAYQHYNSQPVTQPFANGLHSAQNNGGQNYQITNSLPSTHQTQYTHQNTQQSPLTYQSTHQNTQQSPLTYQSTHQTYQSPSTHQTYQSATPTPPTVSFIPNTPTQNHQSYHHHYTHQSIPLRSVSFSSNTAELKPPTLTPSQLKTLREYQADVQKYQQQQNPLKYATQREQRANDDHHQAAGLELKTNMKPLNDIAKVTIGKRSEDEIPVARDENTRNDGGLEISTNMKQAQSRVINIRDSTSS